MERIHQNINVFYFILALYTQWVLLMLENVRCPFNMEFVLIDDFFKIFYPFVKHMVMCCQMCIHQTNGHTIQLKANTHSTFIPLQINKIESIKMGYLSEAVTGSGNNEKVVAHIPTCHPDQFVCIPFRLHANAANAHVL